MTYSAPLPHLSDPTGEQHLLTGQGACIGRAVDCDIVIVSKSVSRQHARIRPEGHYWLLEDLDSTNGTFLNDIRLAVPQKLRDGDQITIGDLTFTFHDPDVTTRDSPIPDLEVDIQAGVVRVDRRPVSLSAKEFALLVYLYQQRGAVCSKDDIGQAVWSEYQEGVYDYQIENLVRRLRTKIESDPADPQIIITIRGLGYKLTLP